MRGRLMFLAGATAGYVLGAKAGRGRYEQIKTQADSLWHDPRVQEKVGQAQSFVAETGGAVVDKAKEKAPEVQAKLGGAADTAKAKVADATGASSAPGEAKADDDMRAGMTPHSEQGQ